jgi:hypothetical protein
MKELNHNINVFYVSSLFALYTKKKSTSNLTIEFHSTKKVKTKNNFKRLEER